MLSSNIFFGAHTYLCCGVLLDTSGDRNIFLAIGREAFERTQHIVTKMEEVL
jgi:hypothetical protein